MAAVTDNITDTTGIRLKDAFVVIIKTEWNAHVTDLLEEGCTNLLRENNIRYRVVEVPGAIEIPFAIKHYWEHSGEAKPDAFITLGCVIRGETPHFEYVCSGVTQGIIQLNILLPVPVIFGVLTVNDQMQADARTGGRHGHKGAECAAAAIKMIALAQSFKIS
ncbi:MAG: 6,7-dimethyl-8-ribityllumazine synthase [Ferruginibacter sp.]